MAVRRILELGDPKLRETSRPVRDAAEAAPALGDMRDTLHEFQRTHGFGRAIAAIQIGEPLRMVYAEFEGVCYSLVNPRFLAMSEEKTRLWDNCFSFPDLLVRVERSASVSMAYQDETGEARTLEASGLLSELLQHELDHLDGVLAVDRAIDRDSLCTKEEWERRHKG
jgi:peptide deformylase